LKFAISNEEEFADELKSLGLEDSGEDVSVGCFTEKQKFRMKPVDEFEMKVKKFGILQGTYFSRKSAGASLKEQKNILSLILKQYANSGIDLSLVTTEWNELLEKEEQETDRSATKEKERKAIIEIESQMKSKPVDEEVEMELTESMDPNFERSWNFYQEAVKRGISDQERIELLESMKIRHGKAVEDRVRKELETIHRRVK